MFSTLRLPMTVTHRPSSCRGADRRRARYVLILQIRFHLIQPQSLRQMPSCYTFICSYVFLNCFALPGKCTCNTGFAGNDCSTKLDEPPIVFSIGNQGACDPSAQTCTIIEIAAENIDDQRVPVCRIQELEVCILHHRDDCY